MRYYFERKGFSGVIVKRGTIQKKGKINKPEETCERLCWLLSTLAVSHALTLTVSKGSYYVQFSLFLLYAFFIHV